MWPAIRRGGLVSGDTGSLQKKIGQVGWSEKRQNYSYYRSVTFIPYCMVGLAMDHLGLKKESMAEQKIEEPENQEEMNFFLTDQNTSKGWLINMGVGTLEAKNADTSQITKELSQQMTASGYKHHSQKIHSNLHMYLNYTIYSHSPSLPLLPTLTRVQNLNSFSFRVLI